MKNKLNRGFLSLVFTLVAANAAWSQNKSLKIGEPIPESLWTTPLEAVNHPQKTITLAPDKDRLILIDFWATWCSSCLTNFPKMEELQQKMDGKIRILPVTDQDRETVQKFFTSKNGQKYSHIRSVIADKKIKQLFPHNAIPYVIWIQDGKVINTTDGEQVTEQSLTEILEGQKSSLQTVIPMDRSRPFMLSENFGLEKEAVLESYSMITHGRVRASPPGMVYRSKDGTITGRLFSNMLLMNIYRVIGIELFRKSNDNFNSKRIVNLLKNPDAISFNTEKETEIANEKLYSFDFISPVSEVGTLYEDMLKALNKATPYVASIRTEAVKCLVLQKIPSGNSTALKNSGPVKNMPNSSAAGKKFTTTDLLRNLNANSRVTPLPVIDQSGTEQNLRIDFSAYSDWNALNKPLSEYNLSLVETECHLPMMIIEDKTQSTNQVNPPNQLN
ncbi:TlpA family protein disulfide reductase [Chryseobacterium sp. R2A-55]|uniref:TlpA family protein disulfide reductase n=1 Tax=Chryseobacterium sp. R2A-55 TaxID=2744445 RepID=UPI001F23CEB9|nr:TlpA disulfide reductase family protein [Chryseobacterium sp. R2A-55]